MGVLAKRFERGRGHLRQRLAGTDRLERLSDPLAEPLRQPVDRREQARRVLGRLPVGGEWGPVLGGYEAP